MSSVWIALTGCFPYYGFRRTPRRGNMRILACDLRSCRVAFRHGPAPFRGISMQKLAVAPLFVATLVLAGCGASNSSGNTSSSSSAPSASEAAPPAPAATAVTGTVKLQDATAAVTPQATLELSLVDVTQQPGVTVNKQD